MTAPASVIKPQMLPGVLGVIAELVSVDAALRVARELGGSRLVFPDNGSLDPQHRLVRAIGAENATRVCARLAGKSATVPHARRYLRLIEVAKLRDRGFDDRIIARHLGMTEAQVNAVPRGDA